MSFLRERESKHTAKDDHTPLHHPHHDQQHADDENLTAIQHEIFKQVQCMEEEYGITILMVSDVGSRCVVIVLLNDFISFIQHSSSLFET